MTPGISDIIHIFLLNNVGNFGSICGFCSWGMLNKPKLTNLIV